MSGVLDWPNAVIADAAFDVASTHNILRFVPPGLASVPGPAAVADPRGPADPGGALPARVPAPAPIDSERFAYYEVAAAMRALERAGESRNRPAGGRPPSELDRSVYADRLLAHVAGITGLAASLPARPW